LCSQDTAAEAVGVAELLSRIDVSDYDWIVERLGACSLFVRIVKARHRIDAKWLPMTPKAVGTAHERGTTHASHVHCRLHAGARLRHAAP
jgi:hypothetical protein